MIDVDEVRNTNDREFCARDTRASLSPPSTEETSGMNTKSVKVLHLRRNVAEADSGKIKRFNFAPEGHLNRGNWIIMRRIFLLVCFLLLIQVPMLVAQKVDLRNYVIGGYDANPNEIRLAQKRVHVYWQKNGVRFGDKVRYLAVEVASVMSGDVIQPLWQNMINAEAGSGFLLPPTWNPGKMRCIMIYDTRTDGFVSNHGYLVVETPHRETLARFSDYIALYVHRGTFW